MTATAGGAHWLLLVPTIVVRPGADNGLQVLEYEHDYLILKDFALVHTSKSGRSYDRTSRGLS